MIINTACGDPDVASRKNPVRRSTYSERARFLGEVILPRCTGFDEVIVAGQFPESLAERYPTMRFVRVAAERRNRWDALLQREVGARFACGRVLVFCHDDHAPAEGFVERLRALVDDESWDILVPRRVHLATGAELNNGRAENYMGGHCYVMRRWLWAAAPLTVAPDEFWDTWWTTVWRDMGAKIVFSDELVHHDVEAMEDER